MNQERSLKSLPPLCYNDQLAAEARAHSENWATNPTRPCPFNSEWQFCGHWDSRPEFPWPEERFSKYGPIGHIKYAENTQWGVFGTAFGDQVVPDGYTWGTARTAVYWWMNHDPANNYAKNLHRAAILNPDFRDAGPGVGRYTPGAGPNGATFTMMFGAR
ncbi:CAP domain-containing protein [Nonomuraea sp. B1E8]|uniref:CAP domain-containing protein n=1 Tax=unclassified Nonomuraea TaxID=2593643 RepID=UPI00325F270E